MLEVAPLGSDTRCFAERRIAACETADTAYVMFPFRSSLVRGLLSYSVCCDMPTSKYHTGLSPVIGKATISACFSVIRNTP